MISVFDKVAATICLLIGLVIGILMTHGFYVAELADARTTIKSLELQRSTDIASTNAAALNRIQIANARSDALQTKLDITAQRLTITQSEVQREIQRNTTGRACLNQRTVSMLNNRTAERSTTASMSTPVSEPVAASGTIASDTNIEDEAATDTDIASWANIVITQYSTCKARLDALIAWHLPSGAGQHD